MIRTIRLFLTGFILCMVFSTCEKEYSVENGGAPGTGGGSTTGTAVYTLTGAPGACSTPIINGIYTAGTALNASNTVILVVDVTTIGTYAVSSSTANGVTFSGAGSFTITGSQIITLTGSGIPAAAGTFSYSHGANGCSFPITFAGVVTNPVAVGTLDCATATTAGTYTQGIFLSSANSVSIPVNVTIAGTYSITSTAANGCTFSGSGTLALGAQTVVLTGSGLPVNSGAISFPVSLGTSSCSFSITFLAGTPPAVGTLDCATATLAGVYTQGVALTAANTISIPVNVTTAGPYLITTTATNGVVFSGSGTLVTGPQTVVLTGSGTATNSGTVSIPVTWGTSSCNVDINFIAGSTDFLKCSIDGGPIVNFSGLSASLVPGDFTASGSSGGQDLQIGVTDVGGGTIGTGVYRNFSLTNTSIFCANQLSIGTTTWFDIDATASSNIFTLTISTITATTITGTFSGKLTDIAGGGSTKMITNGSFSMTY